jgi:nicotinate-nucleotide adenylyltransferase
VQQCYVVPTGVSPFKSENGDFQPFDLRVRWLKAALHGIPKTQVILLESPIEERANTTQSAFYTSDTLERFYELYNHYPYVAIGEDSLDSFPRWKNWESILQRTELIVFRRSNARSNNSGNRILPDFGERVHFLHTPMFEISSTEIRERAKQGKSIRGYVPFPLENEIFNAYRK